MNEVVDHLISMQCNGTGIPFNDSEWADLGLNVSQITIFNGASDIRAEPTAIPWTAED